MGLFSSEKRTYVGTSVSRVIKDNLLPDALKSGLTKALMGNEDIPETMVESLIGSIGIRAEQMYEYGRTKYVHGLPSGQFLAAVDGKDEVTAIISAAEGVPITLLYSHYRPRNFYHIGWQTLTQSYGYNPDTNEITGLSPRDEHPVYLDDMAVVVPASQLAEYEAKALEQWGPPATAGYTPIRKNQGYTGGLRKPTPVLSDPAATEPYIRVDYIWVVVEGGPSVDGDYRPPVTQKDTLIIPVSSYSSTGDYFHVKWIANGVTKYAMYLAGSGTYPQLDAIFNRPADVGGTFFPFAYFRYNYVSENTNKTTQEYKTSKKLVKYLGMQYDKVADAINDSPDITEVMQAMMIMAVPATTTNPLEQRYLFEFFDELFYAGPNQFSTQNWANVVVSQFGSSDITQTSLVIQDRRFKMALSNSGIFKKLVAAKIGKVGSFASSMEEVMVEEQYTTGWQNDNAIATRMIPIPVHVYKKQVSSSMCEEIRVVNLRSLYHVFGDYTVTAGSTDNILLIPLDHSITGKYSISDRETLYARSMHYVFNSVHVVTLEWYQQGWFSFLMTAVAVVVTIYSFGTSSGPMSALMSAIASGSAATISAAALALLQQFLIGMLVGYALRLFAKAVGADIAILVAIAALVYGGYQTYQAGSVAGAPWAKELLQLSSNLTKATMDNVKSDMKNLLAEYESFNLFKDQATKDLEAANKLLEHTHRLDPMVIFGESPNDFYNRTVHSGNVGILGISAISKYVDIALTLPKMNETIGEFSND